jgi:anaphase-promoting complex subunit 12
MLRRKLTRIELKLDDLDEWNTMKREKEMEKRLQNLSKGNGNGADPSDSPMFDNGDNSKSKKEVIHERIGYDPRPKPQVSRPPVN